MNEFIINAVLTVATAFGGAWYGAQLSDRKNTALSRQEKEQAEIALRETYLRHLKEEFDANRILFKEIKTYVSGGPPIAEILEPAVMATAHLRFTAWDALVRAGVLPGLQPLDQKLFRSADWASRRTAEDVQTIAAEWHRALAWEEWNHREREKGERPIQGIPITEFLHQGQRQIKASMDRALEQTEVALQRIEQLLMPEAG